MDLPVRATPSARVSSLVPATGSVTRGGAAWLCDGRPGHGDIRDAGVPVPAGGVPHPHQRVLRVRRARRDSGAHRSASTLPLASGYQLFNLSPVAVVPAVSLIVWWIPLEPVAYALGGLSASSGYLLAVASLFQAIRRVPR